jgi:hypothetical protein
VPVCAVTSDRQCRVCRITRATQGECVLCMPSFSSDSEKQLMCLKWTGQVSMTPIRAGLRLSHSMRLHGAPPLGVGGEKAGCISDFVSGVFL